MPESQCIKTTVKVTVVTDEKKILHRRACDTQDSSNKSTAHQSIRKSSADNKRSVKLPKARKMSKEDFPNAPRRAMNAYMYFAESNRKGNNLTATHLPFIIFLYDHLILTEIFRCHLRGTINEKYRNYERIGVALEAFRGR